MMKAKYMMSALLSAMILPVTAQELPADLDVSISADVVNQYIWRGQELGNTSLQPTLGVSYKGLSLSAGGSVGLSEPKDTKEFDLTLSYTLGGFTVGVTDYWFNTGQDDPKNRYFKYGAHETNHLFEGTVGYDFGWASVQWFTNFAGNDGVKKNGKRAYSSYAEVNVPFRFGGADWTATAGATPYATTSYGASGFAVINLSLRGTKTLRVSDKFSVPLFAGIAANPCSQKAYFVFGFTLQP